MASRDSTTATARPQSDVRTRGDSDEIPTEPSKISRGTEVSRYLVLDTLGTGGMGRVFSAHDPELDRRVAIKVLYDGQATTSSSGANELLREGRALASLRHPSIVSVYDVGWHHGELFIAMEYVEGQTLDAWQREESRGTHALLSRYLEAGRALAAAHDAGIVHGDFKPANVMVETSGRTVVLDFGLARSMTTPERLRDSNEEGTTRGVGTPAYMAPEQHGYDRPTQWSDQFSFCVALYEAFVGKRPFPQKRIVELTEAVLGGRWVDPGTKIPSWVWRVIQRGLRVDPRQRFGDMHALLHALDPSRRRRRLGLAAGGASLAVAAVMAATVTSPQPCERASAQLEGVWDAQVRSALDERHADVAAWPTVRGRLDAFASAWTGAWRESCEATHVSKTQSEALLDQRMACLQADRIAVEAAVRRLEQGDRDMVQRSVRLSAFERDGRRCRREALGRRRPLPPAGPERDRYQDLLRIAAEQYAVSAMANEPNEALATLDATAIEASTHPDVVRALEHARAEAYLQLDRPRDAHDAWAKAARAADAAGDDAAFVRIAGILAYLDVQELDRLDAAEVWLDRAQSRGQNVELSHSERFTLQLRGAVVTRYRGQLEDAVTSLEALLETEGPYATTDQLGTLHHNLGELQNELRNREQAVSQFRLAIDLRSQALGSDHRQVGQSRFLLSRVLIEEGQLEAAEQELEAAAAIFANVEGGAPERVMAEESRAILSAMQGDVARAEEQMLAVIALANDTLDPTDRRIATFLINHARMLMMLGKLDDAATEVRRGLDLEEAAAGPDHHGLADGFSLLAEIELGRGRATEAERWAARAASLAAAPDTKLELQLAALMSRAHAECNASASRAEAEALLDTPPDGVSDRAVAELRTTMQGWDAAVGAYPPCALEAG